MSNLPELIVGWQNDVDVTTLPVEAQHAYQEMRDYNRKAAEARTRFEGIIQSQAGNGQHVVFNYRFGKLSMAMAEGDKADKPAKAPSASKSLQSFLAAAKANGRAS